jgi:hypothetical protein
MELWAWLNNQLLKMQWLSDLVKLLVEDGFGLSMQSPWGASLHFLSTTFAKYSSYCRC